MTDMSGLYIWDNNIIVITMCLYLCLCLLGFYLKSSVNLFHIHNLLPRLLSFFLSALPFQAGPGLFLLYVFLNCMFLCMLFFCIICIQCIIVVNSLWAANFVEQISFSSSPSRCGLIVYFLF